ncbi:hypothetical protein GEMRC1_006088 [Eukaryota sp. GEM-RC1]
MRDSGVGIDGVTTKETHVTLDESDAEALRKLRLNRDGEDVQFISEPKTPKKSSQTASSGAKNLLPIDEFDISNVEYSEELTQDDLARKLKRVAEMTELLAFRKNFEEHDRLLALSVKPHRPMSNGERKEFEAGKRARSVEDNAPDYLRDRALWHNDALPDHLIPFESIRDSLTGMTAETLWYYAQFQPSHPDLKARMRHRKHYLIRNVPPLTSPENIKK